MNGDERHVAEQESEEYNKLALLEELESLLEEMEEQGKTGPVGASDVPHEIRERLVAYGVEDVQHLRSRIMHLHAELDDDDRDLTITES